MRQTRSLKILTDIKDFQTYWYWYGRGRQDDPNVD